MRTLALFFTLLLVLGAGINKSQDTKKSTGPPGFSGVWKLDKGQSSNHQRITRLDDLTLQVVQDNSSLKVVRTIKIKKKEHVQELTYMTNGQGERNPNMLGTQKVKSKSVWSGNSLVSRYTISSWLSSTNEYYNQEASDIWELSKDGSQLKIITEIGEVRSVSDHVRSVIRADRYQMVFNKVP